MEKKHKKKELYAKAIAETKDETLKAFYEHEIELLDKRAINKKENSSSVLRSKVGETPYVSKSDSRSRSSKNKPYFSGK